MQGKLKAAGHTGVLFDALRSGAVAEVLRPTPDRLRLEAGAAPDHGRAAVGELRRIRSRSSR